MRAYINIMAVLTGGAAGAISRLGLDAAVVRVTGSGFPYGILLINILGAFLMGLLQGRIAWSGKPHTVMYNLLGTGFLGGFTTFSTFALDTFSLWEKGNLQAALANIALNTVLCVVAAGLGYGMMATRSSVSR